MDKTQIILFSVVLVIVAFRIYHKYVKKGHGRTSYKSKTSFNDKSPSKEEDYEPYLKK
jgi:hypothetical protein